MYMYMQIVCIWKFIHILYTVLILIYHIVLIPLFKYILRVLYFITLSIFTNILKVNSGKYFKYLQNGNKYV